jgi:hypothetical protein
VLRAKHSGHWVMKMKLRYEMHRDDLVRCDERIARKQLVSSG